MPPLLGTYDRKHGKKNAGQTYPGNHNENITHSQKGGTMKLIEWELTEDTYQEQINIPEAQRKLAADQGISTENKQKVASRIRIQLL